jgi:hypothetical protein
MAGIPLVMHFGLWGAVYGMLLSGLAYTGALALAFALHFYRQIAPPAHPAFEREPEVNTA